MDEELAFNLKNIITNQKQMKIDSYLQNGPTIKLLKNGLENGAMEALV